MAVITFNLSNPVLTAIETWTTAQLHTLGYMTTDQSTGKTYMYVLHDDGGASASTAKVGVPGGAYAGAGDADGVTTLTTVTPDASQAKLRVTCIYHGAPSDGQYGFVEIVKAGTVTTILVDCSTTIIQGTYLQWNADGELDSITVSSVTEDHTLAIAISLESVVSLTYAAVKFLN